MPYLHSRIASVITGTFLAHSATSSPPVLNRHDLY